MVNAKNQQRRESRELDDALHKRIEQMTTDERSDLLRRLVGQELAEWDAK